MGKKKLEEEFNLRKGDKRNLGFAAWFGRKILRMSEEEIDPLIRQEVSKQRTMKNLGIENEIDNMKGKKKHDR